MPDLSRAKRASPESADDKSSLPPSSRASQSALRFFNCVTLAPEPWANGGGVTRTIARGAEYDDGVPWRVSLATLSGAAKFSQFPGFDRTLVLLDDGAVGLHSQDGQLVARSGQPVQFSGDLHVWVTLVPRPVQVLNVMTRREKCRAVVSAHTHSLRVTPAANQVLLSVDSQWTLSSSLLRHVSLAPMNGLWLERRPEALDLSPLGPGARLLSIAIEPLFDH
ncbi:HutD/Ves family protein [Pararobbsia alpina]|uniref:Protein Ves n=1 Tax=Pararobbsia alpina TaxID=621374 RepID=A0A6S7C5D8_9BURK|nr:HutD family protein [Pararobbsia alpina]CAB3801668.1 Protein Ves [Pararobbsia alpina]